jgi:rubrerythrin
MNAAPRALSGLLFGLLFLGMLYPLTVAGADPYPQTRAALQERYADEIVAHRTYGAYALHAESEGYPAIAHLFRTLAASEAIHAKNFAQLLHELGEKPRAPKPAIQLSSTREHLKRAATVEAAEIDREYPAILERIKDEAHEQATVFITYAWKAEQQHRDLILKIKKGASWFFGKLVSKIEGNPTRYFVCQVCGSTVTELPGNQCPICDHPPEDYREVL